MSMNRLVKTWHMVSFGTVSVWTGPLTSEWFFFQKTISDTNLNGPRMTLTI